MQDLTPEEAAEFVAQMEETVAEPPPVAPDVFQLLFKSAQNGHGRTLQPSQVGEIVETMMALDHQGRQMAGKVEALTRVIYCMLVARDPVLIDDGTEQGLFVSTPFTMSEEYYEQQDYERGFNIDWDEDTGTITVALGEATESEGEAVGVPEVRDGELAAEGSEGDQPPVPESSEGESEAPEPSGDEAVGPLDSEDESESE
jgi:hypothetical protein